MIKLNHKSIKQFVSVRRLTQSQLYAKYSVGTEIIMKTKKILGAALMSGCLMAGCVNPMASVYDNDSRIASASNSYNLNNIEQTSADGYFIASVEKMEGMDTIWVYEAIMFKILRRIMKFSMDTIWVYEAKEDTALDITYKLNVSSGKVKLALINPNGEIIIIAECDSEMADPAQSTLNVESGNNRIKIVAGENTRFDIELTISEGEFKELG